MSFDVATLTVHEALALRQAGLAAPILVFGYFPPPLAPQLIDALREKDAGDIIVICGGVIPQQDYQFLYDAGVKAIFGPGTNIPKAAQDILKLIAETRA